LASQKAGLVPAFCILERLECLDYEAHRLPL